MANTATKKRDKQQAADNSITDDLMTREDITRVKELPDEMAKLHQTILASQEMMLEEIQKVSSAQASAAAAQTKAATAVEHAAEVVDSETEWVYYDADDNEITEAEYLAIQAEEEGRGFFGTILHGAGKAISYGFPHTRKETFHVVEGAGIGAYLSQTTGMFNWMGGSDL